MFTYSPMSHARLAAHLEQLQQLCKIDEATIKTIYGQGEPDIDLSKIEYSYSIPLYQKIIFRFRSESRLVGRFFRGLDPGNQHMLLSHYKLASDGHELVEFLAFLTTSLGLYDLEQLSLASAIYDYDHFISHITNDAELNTQIITRIHRSHGDDITKVASTVNKVVKLVEDNHTIKRQKYLMKRKLKLWQTNEIEFFLALSLPSQVSVLAKYNEAYCRYA